MACVGYLSLHSVSDPSPEPLSTTTTTKFGYVSCCSESSNSTVSLHPFQLTVTIPTFGQAAGARCDPKCDSLDLPIQFILGHRRERDKLTTAGRHQSGASGRNPDDLRDEVLPSTVHRGPQPAHNDGTVIVRQKTQPA